MHCAALFAQLVCSFSPYGIFGLNSSIGCAWCTLFHHPVFRNMATWIQLINTRDEGLHCIRKQTNNWVEMKCRVKLPNNFAVYITKEQWPNNWCNKWDSHCHEVLMNKYINKEVERSETVSHVASELHWSRDNHNKIVWWKDS